MLRQIMVLIFTPLGHAQIYDEGVRIVFVMIGINERYINNSNSSNNNNNNLYATHEHDNGF